MVAMTYILTTLVEDVIIRASLPPMTTSTEVIVQLSVSTTHNSPSQDYP